MDERAYGARERHRTFGFSSIKKDNNIRIHFLRIGWDCVTPLESYPTTQSHLFLFIYIHTYFLRGEL